MEYVVKRQNLVAKHAYRSGAQSRVFRDRKKDHKRGYTKHNKQKYSDS